MTTRSCFVCDKLHSSQFPDELLTCDEHTYITKQQASKIYGIEEASIARYAKEGLITTWILGNTGEPSSVGRKHNRYSLKDVKNLISEVK